MNHLEREDRITPKEVRADARRFSAMQEPGSNSSATSGTIQTLKR